MKKTSLFFAVFLLVFSGTALSYSSKKTNSKKTPKKIQSEAGLNIPDWGVAIDAVYDSRLDNLVPGYKILNVILTNRGAANIYLDPKKDKWRIRDNLGKSVTAINHLREESEKIWMQLPPALKDKLEYPHAVRVGHSTKIDLFFPVSVQLAHFREISWASSHFKREFNIQTMTDKDLEGDSKEEETPKNSRSYKQSIEKYEGERRTNEPLDLPADIPPEKPSPPPRDDDFSIPAD